MRVWEKWVSQWGYLTILLPLVGLNALVLHLADERWIYLLPSSSGTVAILCCIFLERMRPFRKEWRRGFWEARWDLFQTVIVLPAIIFICCFIWIWITQFMHLNEWTAGFWWSKEAPWLIHFASAFFLAEFFFYWVHRISHQASFFWKLHRVHHEPEQLDWYNAGKFHSLDLFLNFFFYVAPFFIFPVPRTAFIMVLSLNVITGVLEHANIQLRSGWLNWIINTGELHRWHHSIIEEESKKNYGKVLSIWDIVFRSFLIKDLSGLKKIGVH